MLQLKKISKLLSKGLIPISTGSEISLYEVPKRLNNSPLSISLLSSDGIALTTVVNSSLLKELNLSSDSLKIDALIGYNYLNQQLQQFWKTKSQKSDINGEQQEQGNQREEQEEELVCWTVIELENDLKLIIQMLDTFSRNSPPLYIILFYHKQFPDEIAKLKSDNLKQALNIGLQGYSS